MSKALRAVHPQYCYVIVQLLYRTCSLLNVPGMPNNLAKSCFQLMSLLNSSVKNKVRVELNACLSPCLGSRSFVLKAEVRAVNVHRTPCLNLKQLLKCVGRGGSLRKDHRAVPWTQHVPPFPAPERGSGFIQHPGAPEQRHSSSRSVSSFDLLVNQVRCS